MTETPHNMLEPTMARATHLMVAAGLSAALAACSSTPLSPVAIETEPAQSIERVRTPAPYQSSAPRAPVDPASVANDAPEIYTVVKGDTLWDISGRFLNSPWLWPRVWDYNPQIANPHLIYPGDQIALEYIDGVPTLVLQRNGKRVPINQSADAGADAADSAGGERSRLSPSIRVESLDNAIPTISGNAINAFLAHPQIVSAEQISAAPYVLGSRDGNLVSATGNTIFVRGELHREQANYGVYRPGKALYDPVTEELLGHEITHVSDARLINIGDPSTMTITNNTRETAAGDILINNTGSARPGQYLPRIPVIKGEGRIVSLVDAISQSGRNQVVVLNLGDRSGIKVGDVLAVESRGKQMIDLRGRGGYESVTLPNMRTGVLMVFQTFDKVSYALVMESNRPVTANDIVTGI